jgi:hypothetical protein
MMRVEHYSQIQKRSLYSRLTSNIHKSYVDCKRTNFTHFRVYIKWFFIIGKIFVNFPGRERWENILDGDDVDVDMFCVLK